MGVYSGRGRSPRRRLYGIQWRSLLSLEPIALLNHFCNRWNPLAFRRKACPRIRDKPNNIDWIFAEHRHQGRREDNRIVGFILPVAAAHSLHQQPHFLRIADLGGVQRRTRPRSPECPEGRRKLNYSI